MLPSHVIPVISMMLVLSVPESPVPETEIPLPLSGIQEDIASTSEINTIDNRIQTPVKQRKVSKIVVLFDDGSFQEM